MKDILNVKGNKGITLIALIVTIIILIILAGISIRLVLGDNGLLEKAKISKGETEKASIKEEIQSDIVGKQAENNGNISDDSLKEVLEKHGILSEEEKLKDKTLTTTKGNYEIKVSDIFNGTTVKEEQKEPVFTTIANKPDIRGFNEKNTYYVSWDLKDDIYTINDKTLISGIAPSNWYDYTAGENKWANIKTTGGGNDCYWVWIPRYAYKVPTKSSTAQTIEIKFLDKATNIPIGETEAITNKTPTPGTWVVHPAFTKAGNGGFGELTGIWVAKFEASSSSVSENTVYSDLSTTGGGNVTNLKVRVKPNVTSWRGITLGNIFKVCQNLTLSGNSLANTTNIDAHMMKNTEWGACAYLSRSVYGKNGQVYNNPYFDNTTNNSPITGLCGNTADYKTTTYNDINTYKYNTEKGVNASTSGNVYGIYDMAGGAWEYVAGIQSSKKSNSNYYNFSNISTKYYDSYSSYNNTKYGDAIYETSTSSSEYTSWDVGYSRFVSSGVPVFLRGGRAGDGIPASIFAFSINTGEKSDNGTFRPCLVSPQ